MADNGEAIYGSRPWVVTESTTTEGTPLRFTKSGEGVYALVWACRRRGGSPCAASTAWTCRRVRLVGAAAELAWSVGPGGDLTVTLPERLPLAPVTVLDRTEVRARLRDLA